MRDQSLDRKFFVNRSYGGCPNDYGWFVVVDKYQACDWEKKGPVPIFLFTRENTRRNWNTGKMLFEHLTFIT